MKTEILDLKLIDKELVAAENHLSFTPFVGYLKNLGKEQSLKNAVYQSVVDKFESEGLSGKHINVDEAAKLSEQLSLIYMILTPLISAETEHLWALSTPIPSKVFYSTNAFYNFHVCENSCAFARNIDNKNLSSSHQRAFIYRLVLQKFYNIESVLNNDIYIQGVNHLTQQPIFYRIHIDTRFVEIELNGKLPELNNELIEAWLWEEKGDEFLEDLLPLSLFTFTGFSILDFSDVTEEHALENLKDILVDHSEMVDFNAVNQSLQIIAGKNNIDFGVLPFMKVNGRSVYLHENCSQSVIMNSAIKYNISEDVFHNVVEQYESNAEIIVFNTISEQKQVKHPFLRVLKQAGVNSYALLPVYYHRQLLGILEVYSKEKVFFDKILLSRLQDAMPYISQLLKLMLDEFNDSIEAIVRDNFTSLKPSVKWKFNEVAWDYLQDSMHNTSPKIGKIGFSQVYPFYGAVDVRQSTHERNKAILEDTTCQIELLESTLTALEEHLSGSLKDKLISHRHKWTNFFNAYLATKDEMMLIHEMEREIDPFLEEAKLFSEKSNTIVQSYFDAISETDGMAYKNRRELEVSLQTINQSINRYLLDAQKDLQKVFPHYFEKFRTDGVEYDIYLGESMAPHREFSYDHVKNMRLWQLKSMAEIAVATRQLKTDLPKPLQTTQLIFIHSTPINIGFRSDEKRFDVEGGYSIRYEVVKKRIDKVLIKHTNERLTQPEKIALVYFNELESEEYLTYIETLQAEGYLEDDLEFLDLEELQGVHGLKALRVGVK